jgi:hypothetical protein
MATKSASVSSRMRSRDYRVAITPPAELEAAIGAAGVDISALKRKWQASIALAEFQAARINLMCKFAQSDKTILVFVLLISSSLLQEQDSR